MAGRFVHDLWVRALGRGFARATGATGGRVARAPVKLWPGRRALKLKLNKTNHRPCVGERGPGYAFTTFWKRALSRSIHSEITDTPRPAIHTTSSASDQAGRHPLSACCRGTRGMVACISVSYIYVGSVEAKPPVRSSGLVFRPGVWLYVAVLRRARPSPSQQPTCPLLFAAHTGRTGDSSDCPRPGPKNPGPPGRSRSTWSSWACRTRGPLSWSSWPAGARPRSSASTGNPRSRRSRTRPPSTAQAAATHRERTQQTTDIVSTPFPPALARVSCRSLPLAPLTSPTPLPPPTHHTAVATAAMLARTFTMAASCFLTSAHSSATVSGGRPSFARSCGSCWGSDEVKVGWWRDVILA